MCFRKCPLADLKFQPLFKVGTTCGSGTFTTEWTVPTVAIWGPVLQAGQQHLEGDFAYGHADRANHGILIIVLPAKFDKPRLMILTPHLPKQDFRAQLAANSSIPLRRWHTSTAVPTRACFNLNQQALLTLGRLSCLSETMQCLRFAWALKEPCRQHATRPSPPLDYPAHPCYAPRHDAPTPQRAAASPSYDVARNDPE